MRSWGRTGRGFLVAMLSLGFVECRDGSPEAPPERPPAQVVTGEVSAGPLVVTQRYLGEVWATSEASMAAEEPGRVRQVLVVEGNRVKAGDLLVELDDRLAEAALTAANAEKKQALEESIQAGREQERFALLAEEKVASELEAEQKRAAFLASRAAKKASDARAKLERERVRRHRIVAPFGGVVSRRLVDPGDWMSVGTVAIQLVDADGLEILTPVPADELTPVKKAIEVRLVRGSEQVKARLGTAVQAVDRETRTALIRYLPEQRPEWLLPGTVVDVQIDVLADGGLVVPFDAVTYGVADDAVFRIKDGKAERVPIRVLQVSADRALVQGPITVGDRVVVRGNERLMPGQPVVEGQAVAPPGAGSPPGAPHQGVPGAPPGPAAPGGPAKPAIPDGAKPPDQTPTRAPKPR